jgi:methanogenic corrinoid protein MtbC1
MWERDECDFVDVTMGLWRLQEVMRDIAARAPEDHDNHAPPRSALFSPMPGDNHQFGAIMIEEVFSRGGWKSDVLIKPERRELLDRLTRERFDLVGLTLARDCPSAAVGNLIKAMRNVSANPNLFVLVGGRMINDNPSVAIEVGADGTAPDALAALELANSMVKVSAARDLNLR